MVFVAAITAFKWLYPTYSYHHRLTINIETDGKLHSGSSVVEVIWYTHFMPELVSFSPQLRGQAALFDLGPRGVVVATLFAEDWGWHNTNAGWGKLLFLAHLALMTASTDCPQWRVCLENVRNLPRVLWFSSPQDPRTAKTILR